MKNAKLSGAVRLIRALIALLTVLLLLGCDVAVKPSRHEDQSVLGTWYMSGDVRKACHILCSPEGLEVGNEFGMTSRLVYDKTGFVIAADWLDGLRGDVRDGAILCANETWWSRSPIPNGSQC